MPSEGTVREWSDDEGTGVIDSADTPGGCWVHFSHITTDGFRGFTPGDRVTFTHEAVRQDGFAYRAARVWGCPAKSQDHRRNITIAAPPPPTGAR